MSIQKRKRNLLFITGIFSILASATTLLIYVMNARMSIYPYDTTIDYNYDFNGTNAKFIDLYLKDGQFKLPLFKDTNYSVFLKIDISTTFMGQFFQPKIKLNVKKASIQEYFENGTNGCRYINLSPLISEAFFESDIKKNPAENYSNDKVMKEGLNNREYSAVTLPEEHSRINSKSNSIDVKMTGTRVKLKDQPIKLILFRNQEIKHSRILIIAPHPDDAEIAAFGLYSTHKNTYIVTVTAGDAGTYKYDEIYSNRKNHFLKKGKIRTWNSITVPLLVGISPEQVVNLGFFDGTLETMFKVNPSTVKALYTGISNINIFRQQNISSLSNILEGEANWDSLVNNLDNLLKKIKPDIIVTPYPALDKHPDHKYASIALFEAIKKADIKSGCLYLYTNHFVINEYYPYGKMGGVISLPPIFSLPSALGDRIYFRSIYSHLLSADRQKDKIISLEAMNDLRPDTTWRFSEDIIKMAFASIKRDILGQNVSYYRRAVRNNELFFVIDINDIYNKSILNRITGMSL